jgi:tRNA(Ile)-lysidine synthase
VRTGASGEAVELARDRLLGYHPHVRARVLRELVRRLGGAPDGATTRRLAHFVRGARSGAGVEVQSGIRMEREFDTIRIFRPAPPAHPSDESALVITGPSAGQGRLGVGGRTYTVRWSLAARSGDAGQSAEFDPSALRFPLVMRGWRPGDRIRLGYGSKKLKKLFVERRLGRGARQTVPILADAGGQVVWAVGVGRSVDAVPLHGNRIFSITVEDGEPR